MRLDPDSSRPPRTLRAIVESARGTDQRTRVALASIAGLALFFIVLAQEVFEGDTRRFDEAVLLSLRNAGDLTHPLGPVWFQEAMRDVTALGSTVVLALIVIAVTGFLAITGRRRTAGLVLAAVISGTLLSSLFKHGFARPRPDLVPHGTVIYTASFPSGHAMMSTLVYLTLGSLLARTQASGRVRTYILAAAAMTALLVGFSRVYLGVHWPTDVVAGWALGGLWALISGLVMARLQSRGDIEPADPDAIQGLS